MAKPKPAKPDPNELRLLPMLLKVGNRFVDATGEWEVAGRPYTANQGKNVHVRVRRVDDPAVGGIRSWPAHERIATRRPEQGSGPR